MKKKNRKSKLNVEISKHKAFPAKHTVSVILGTGDKDYQLPENLAGCVNAKLGCDCKNKTCSAHFQNQTTMSEVAVSKVYSNGTSSTPDVSEHKPNEEGDQKTTKVQHSTDARKTDWPRALPMAESASAVRVPAIELTSGFGCFSRNRLSKMPADLLVVSVMHNAKLAGPFQALDESMGRVLSDSIFTQQFTGKLGQRFLLDISQLGGPQKYALVVGLGEPQLFTGHTACSLFRLVTEAAEAVGAKTVLLPIPPRRLWTDQVSLRGTGAILRCRLEERAKRGKLSCLEKFEVVCSPQARKYFEEGLSLTGPRCQTCADPQMPIVPA